MGDAGLAPPTGTATFLFTDIEGSTRLWEELPDVTYSPQSFTQYGDETIAIRVVETPPTSNDWVYVSDVVAVRVGSVIGVVQHTDAFSVSSSATEQYVELLATRMQSIPQG